jgi:replicative superfamily II helicase
MRTQVHACASLASLITHTLSHLLTRPFIRPNTLLNTHTQPCSYPNTKPITLSSTFRIVAVSATLPNICELAAFVGANEAHVFDESYRPVPLTTHVVSVGHIGENKSGEYRFWSSLDREVPPLIHQFSKQRPAIVFCHSKADTEKLADLLATSHGIAVRDKQRSDLASKTRISRLQRVLLSGIGYHHAGE